MSDEYTPTTEEVRSAWMYFNNDTENWESRTQMKRAGAEFDRWLREHDAKVWDEGRIWVADLLVWLADARADYTGPEIEFQVATTRNLADIVRGTNDATGWLPSWRWDEFEKIAAALRVGGNPEENEQ